MEIQTALQLIDEHFEHARARHPELKSHEQWQRLLASRLDDLRIAYDATDHSDHMLVAGKRALQIAAMCLRAIDDLGLGLVPPIYHATNLPHTEI